MRKHIGTVTLGLALASASPAHAHSGATGIVKERMEAMKSIGGEMKAVGGMFQGKVEFNTMRIEKAAGVIHDHASKIEKLFPKGSDHKPTRALPEVWKDKVEFDAIAMEMAKAAIKQAEKSKTAQSTNDIKTEF